MFRGLKVSHVIYLGLLLVFFGVSYDNIHQLALSQHAQGFAAIGLAIGISGTAALTVYVSVIAQTKRLTWTAVVLAVFFGAVSGILQFQHYLTLGTPFWTALGFGWGVPVMEAMIAVIEGLIAWEMKTLAPDLTTEFKATIAQLQAAGADLKAKYDEGMRSIDRLHRQNESLKRDLADTRQQRDDARNSAAIGGALVMDSTQLPARVNATMLEVDAPSSKTQANVLDAVELLTQGPVTSAGVLAERAEKVGKKNLANPRTVQRVLNTAMENGVVVKTEEGYALP